VNNNEIAILFCSNRAYCEPMATAIASLLANNPDYAFRIFAVVSDDAAEERERIFATVQSFSNAAITFRKYDCATLQGFPFNQRITLDAYIRLFLDDILDPDIDRLIYLDCDLIVCGDIGELWRTPLGEGQVLGAAQDPFSENLLALGLSQDDPYYNSGVLLIDVRRWKALGMTEKLVQYILRNAPILRYHDQDAINAVLCGRIHSLPLKWNFSPRHADAGPEMCGLSTAEFREVRSRPAIVHFTGLKPWLNETHYRKSYYRYHEMTPWHAEREASKARGLKASMQGLAGKSKAWVKWHLPSLSRNVRKWTGLGDPVLRGRE
jgi:lipopolysaccharide biosynthesis glycosyltransferase